MLQDATYSVILDTTGSQMDIQILGQQVVLMSADTGVTSLNSSLATYFLWSLIMKLFLQFYFPFHGTRKEAIQMSTNNICFYKEADKSTRARPSCSKRR